MSTHSLIKKKNDVIKNLQNLIQAAAHVASLSAWIPSGTNFTDEEQSISHQSGFIILIQQLTDQLLQDWASSFILFFIFKAFL